jgi:single-strand DNA-binding protein
MARGFNKVILMGNLADPEVRYATDRQANARFAVAVNQEWKDKNGEKQESVDFIPVVVWGPMAENCEKYLRKGSRVLVEGRIQVRSYEAKDGGGSGTPPMLSKNWQPGLTFLGGGERSEGGGFPPEESVEDIRASALGIGDDGDGDADIPF